MPREGIGEAGFAQYVICSPSLKLRLMRNYAWLPPCSSTCSFFGRGAQKGEEWDW